MSLTYFPISHGDVIVVLGACRGEETEYFADGVGETGLVLAVEPMRENYEFIEKKRNPRVKLFKGAVADKSGTARIYVGTNLVNHSLLRDWGKGERFVPCLSWDDLVERYSLNKVKLLYMDIEGAEMLVLKGMTKIFPDYITLEHHVHIGINKEPLLKLLRQRNYSYEDGKRYIYARRN